MKSASVSSPGPSADNGAAPDPLGPRYIRRRGVCFVFGVSVDSVPPVLRLPKKTAACVFFCLLVFHAECFVSVWFGLVSL